jgi:hypothetical protein
VEQMVSTEKQMEDIHQSIVSVVLNRDYSVRVLEVVDDDDFEPIPGTHIVEIQTPTKEARQELVKLIKREAAKKGLSANATGSRGTHLRVLLEQEKVEV